MAVKINGINHCAISVADIEETIKWYHDVFGFTVVNRSEIPGAGIKVAHLQGVGFCWKYLKHQERMPCRKIAEYRIGI